jgi:dextranase
MLEKTDANPVTLHDLWSDRATYTPGEDATINLRLRNSALTSLAIVLDVHLSWLDETIAEHHHRLEIAAGDHEVRLPLALPSDSFRGYGVDVSVRDHNARLLAQRSIGLDVLEHWTQAPRYGFLSDFSPGDQDAVTHVSALARYHVNVVQFYDWMWRHYALMPPEDIFIDGCGRTLSLEAVRQKVAACKMQGMAAIGYAAVYGAEPEYALEHPAEMLYDADGAPYSLGKLFYIMNIHQDNPWRTRILASMAEAVKEVPFDGLHLDQYGFPRENVFGPAPDRVAYDLAKDFPPFIDDARVAIRAASPASRVIFNAVMNWPIETVAPTSQDATYIEIWPPYESYSDLQKLILEARRLAPTKQVILAAYLEPLKDAQGDALIKAEAAALFTSAAIWANGGFHLLMGEHNAALCDPYYPDYTPLRPDFADVMRRYYDFVVRYENVLSDLDLVTLPGTPEQQTVNIPGLQVSSCGEAGKIWTITRTKPGLTTVGLINLSEATDTHWNAPKAPALSRHNIEVEIQVAGTVQSIFAASPDHEEGRPQPLAHTLLQRGERTWVRVSIPHLHYWSTIVIKTLSETTGPV